jgi:SAM-dependent methyltransferase
LNGLCPVTSCQLCGSTEREPMFRDEPFEVVRCKRCGLVYVTPRHGADTLLESVYGESYWRSDSPKQKGYADYAKDAQLYLKTYRLRVGLIASWLDGRKVKVLDVGCAAGYFLQVMRERGHDVWGSEVSAPIAKMAQDVLGEDRVHVGLLAGAAGRKKGFEPGSFDLVTLWDVVEHVPEPQSLLREVRAMLKPDGLLVLETQNVKSGFARLLGRRWQHYKHEEHLYHFDPSTVEELLRQTGFVVVHNTPSYGGKYVSFGFIRERAGRVHGR